MGEFRVLTAPQEHRIRQDIVDKTPPDQMKLSFALWNAQAVRAFSSGRCAVTCSAGDLRRKGP